MAGLWLAVLAVIVTGCRSLHGSGARGSHATDAGGDRADGARRTARRRVRSRIDGTVTVPAQNKLSVTGGSTVGGTVIGTTTAPSS
jgi:hypothetical protein